MFPENYKHPSKQQKGLITRLTSKTSTLFKKTNQETAETNGWTV